MTYNDENPTCANRIGLSKQIHFLGTYMSEANCTKRCAKCGEEKLRSEFYKEAQNKDGLMGSCKTCRRHYQENWRSQNPEYMREYQKQWKSENASSVRQYNRQWNAKNATHVRAYNKRRQPIQNSHTAKRRSIALQATPEWANVELISREYELAAWCTKVTGVKYEVDHIIPLKNKLVCGLHVEGNLRVITRSDNRSKNNKFEIM